jgi:hypothetical protein
LCALESSLLFFYLVLIIVITFHDKVGAAV